MEGLCIIRLQTSIIEGLMAARKARRHGDRWLEVYLTFDPGPKLDYGPYHGAIEIIGG